MLDGVLYRRAHIDAPLRTTHMTSSLTTLQDGPVLRITLNRPERRNSLSRELVAALTDTFTSIQEGAETRVIVLSGEGPVFCSGADIEEFLSAAESGRALKDAEGVADLLAAMMECPVPIVARVTGAAFGGGVGLVCACDIAIASTETTFSLSEARLGLAAAVISPYVIAAMGEREAKARMLLGAPFDANEALRIGVVHQVTPESDLKTATDDAVSNILRCAPGALAAIKRLTRQLRSLDAVAARNLTTNLLAKRLASAEGQEGLRAFTEKRPAAWSPK
jgi:methylglutaconyl-CoA hydratase